MPVTITPATAADIQPTMNQSEPVAAASHTDASPTRTTAVQNQTAATRSR